MALLTGKTAVITGGSTGIGFATAKRFIDEGAHVFITGRRQVELDLAVKKLGDNATGVQGDVSKAEDVDRLYTAVADSGRRVDVVFANAAILEAARIEDVTEEQLENYQRSIVPMARYGAPDEVANAVLFLASDLSSFTTGADIPVDGGINQI